MNEMNVNDIKRINELVFQRKAKWQCSHCAGEQLDERIMCGRPATHVIEWRHQDGDRERRLRCHDHAVEQQKYWSPMDWDACVEVSDIEDWELHLSYGGRTATRVGNNVPNA